MVTVHRVPVVDSVDEIVQLKQGWQDYLSQADSYEAVLSSYRDAVEQDIESGSTGLQVFLDKLIESYDELEMERAWVNRQLEDSELRGHASYPQLGREAVQQFRKEYGVPPGRMLEEDPRDFYFAVANDFIDREDVEWRVEERQVKDLEELVRMVESCKASGAIELEVENEALPDTGIDGKAVETDVFREILEAHGKAGEQATYDAVAPFERHLYDSYDRSVLNEIWGMEMNQEVLDQIEQENEFSTAAD